MTSLLLPLAADRPWVAISTLIGLAAVLTIVGMLALARGYKAER